MTENSGPLIRARDVAKIYKVGGHEVRALDGVSFEIARGEFVSIMGTSGSGKSTLLNLIGALDIPTSGALEIDGVDLSGLSADALAELRNRTIGFVFQQFNLLPRTTALRQVMLPLSYSGKKVANPVAHAQSRLQAVDLGDRMAHVPSQLSGGQQQRVAIARALVNEPRIILADEPTGALDSRTSQEIMNLFARLHQRGMTIIVVTHEPEIAACAHRTITFRDGRILSDEWREPLYNRATA